MLLPLILASNSPRRKELLTQAGIPFEVVPSLYEEHNHPGILPAQLVEEQALGKALEVAHRYPERTILGADTLVALDQSILGKPKNAQEAHAMLTEIQGRWHEVYTGIALVYGKYGSAQKTHVQTTKVHLRALSPQEITDYIATQEPMDKAGAYAIQGYGALLVDAIEGCYTNVVGLSLPVVWDLLQPFGWRPFETAK
ncbi:MAG: Maf family protein [Gloeobacterales cyanobacterium]